MLDKESKIDIIFWGLMTYFGLILIGLGAYAFVLGVKDEDVLGVIMGLIIVPIGASMMYICTDVFSIKEIMKAMIRKK